MPPIPSCKTTTTKWKREIQNNFTSMQWHWTPGMLSLLLNSYPSNHGIQKEAIGKHPFITAESEPLASWPSLPNVAHGVCCCRQGDSNHRRSSIQPQPNDLPSTLQEELATGGMSVIRMHFSLASLNIIYTLTSLSYKSIHAQQATTSQNQKQIGASLYIYI